MKGSFLDLLSPFFYDSTTLEKVCLKLAEIVGKIPRVNDTVSTSRSLLSAPVRFGDLLTENGQPDLVALPDKLQNSLFVDKSLHSSSSRRLNRKILKGAAPIEKEVIEVKEDSDAEIIRNFMEARGKRKDIRC